MISIKGLDKAEVLVALWKASREQGISRLGNPTGTPLTLEEARKQLETSPYCDYVKGRVIKCNLGGDEFDDRLFDRDLGSGAAERAIKTLRTQE